MTRYPTFSLPQLAHENYFEVEARTHCELGQKLGKLFGKGLLQDIQSQKEEGGWREKTLRATPYLNITQKIFPHLVEELHGYAEGANISFTDLWTLNMEDELDELKSDKCTTVVTNHGKLIAHNEDWYADYKDTICVLKKTVGNLTVFELFYTNTLGGNAISINSHGFIQTINSLTHSDQQIGVPRDVIARWLSETSSPDTDFQRLKSIPRSAGYNHNILNLEGKIWNIECSAQSQEVIQPGYPFVHTNHFLSRLSRFEEDDNSCGTLFRYQHAWAKVRRRMSTYKLKNLMSHIKKGNKVGIFNEHTIGRMLIDLVSMNGYVWLRREAERGWVEYDLSFARPHKHKRQLQRPFAVPSACG